ncbi:gamma-glutamyltransferase [Saccharibacter sp. 17.LH.SD]|uniref:gamma-glutamyltransferase family protein n=1 Tax=Saccharibacter sp. 17.LH.SD TaxID=2689393 RepID=UPI0013680212|nr:gamma-glutamyltransferase family protein [Saccharibacter sp. 17.LH.SD]MXV43705.1 gamma-glutamyltransferase [Saccharibacter sp. 17.LH.SD]
MHTATARKGLVSSPHHLASQAGCDVLKEGGTAIEATIAIASTLSVIYPHMTGLGGDGFWLILTPDGKTQAIDACGCLAQRVTLDWYQKKHVSEIPWRGGLAANTVAGTVSGWEAALRYSEIIQRPLPLHRLLQNALYYASHGRTVSRSESAVLCEKNDELQNPHFRKFFFPSDGRTPLHENETVCSPALAHTFHTLIKNGLSSFYEGELARSLVHDLQQAGSPLIEEDFLQHKATYKTPLHIESSHGQLYNTAPPTQGAASLLILALFDRLKDHVPVETADYLHLLVEATKQAFIYRNRFIDGHSESENHTRTLFASSKQIDQIGSQINRYQALPWTAQTQWGDTTWMGAIDGNGMAVSMIQSLYFEYGSGVLLPQSGIIWQNRGSSFRLAPSGWNALTPGRKPFHTLNPAAARLHDGRTLVYGTMGGEGQPQTQAALFTRHVHYGVPIQESINRPRWLLGRTWGNDSLSLKIEPGFSPDILHILQQRGHIIEELPARSSLMGHAGMLSRHAHGLLEGGYDPRSDGSVAGW